MPETTWARPRLVEFLQGALTELGWTNLNSTALGRWLGENDFEPNLTSIVGSGSRGTVDERPVESCRSTSPICLLTLLNRLSQGSQKPLNGLGRKQLKLLIDYGVKLFVGWPKFQPVQRWLGKRLFLLHGQALTHPACLTWNSIVASRMGRHHRHLPYWPELLNWAVESTGRERAELLIAPGTTLAPETRQYAQQAGLSLTELILPTGTRRSREPTIQQWLITALSEAIEQITAQPSMRKIHLSPAFDESPCDPMMNHFPLRDRAAIALADRVKVIALRPGGAIDGLLQHRLDDHSFPVATVQLAVPLLASARTARSAPSTLKKSTSETRLQLSSNLKPWLDRGVIGQLIRIDDNRHRWLRCMDQCCPNKAVLQPCMAIEKWMIGRQGSWHYLTHCTRGNGGAYPQESQRSHLARVWHEGVAPPNDPLNSLLSILKIGAIRGTSQLTRGSIPMVCFSELSLLDLLHRRTFQAHLGRWDWEPYGILFERSVLRQARPVRYGSSNEANQISADDMPYFQPVGSKQQWQLEREWRIAGELNLRMVPPTSAAVFVRWEIEARQIAAYSPFPVLWLHSQTGS